VTEKAAPTTRNPSDLFTRRAIYGSADGWLFGIDVTLRARRRFHFCIVRLQDVRRLFLQRSTPQRFAVASPIAADLRRDGGGRRVRQRSDPRDRPRRGAAASRSRAVLVVLPSIQTARRAPQARAWERRTGTLACIPFFRKKISKFLSPKQSEHPAPTRPLRLSDLSMRAAVDRSRRNGIGACAASACDAAHFARSITTAIPCPTPMHIVTNA